MADEHFVVDTDKAQRMGERLTSAGQAIGGFPPAPRPSGPLGNTGALDSALSELERTFATAKQDLAQKINGTADGFKGLATDVTNLDQQKAQEAEAI